jgi:hypothetical protein
MLSSVVLPDTASAGFPSDAFECSEAGLSDAVARRMPNVELLCSGPTEIRLSKEIVLQHSMEIDGGGHVTFIPAPGVPAFSTIEPVRITLRRMTITGGTNAAVSVGAGDSYAGLWMYDVRLVGNSGDRGGAVVAGMGSSVYGENTLISGNTAREGGGVMVEFGSSVELVNSVVSDNTAELRGGGISTTTATQVDLKNSIIARNRVVSAEGKGGGVYVARGATSLLIDGSTVSANRAVAGAALYGSLLEFSMDLRQSTIAFNVAGVGGAAVDIGTSKRPSSTTGIIVSGNSPQNCRIDPTSFGTVRSSVDDGDTCGFASTNGSVSNARVRLGEMSERGHSLRFGSAGVDLLACDSQASDGDGDGVALCDAGALEYSPSDVEPIPPVRLLDTRPNQPTIDGRFAGNGALAAGQTLELEVTGRGRIPRRILGVVVNLTAVNARGGGYVTVYPCGEPVPRASNLNISTQRARGNGALVRLGANDRLCVYSSQTTDLVIDVNGLILRGGSLELTPAVRLTDTRPNGSSVDGQAVGQGQRPAGSVTIVPIADRGGTPDDARSSVVNIAAVEPGADGFLTVYRCQDPRPNTATVVFQAGQTTANMTIADSSGGSICIFNSSPTHIVVDSTAYERSLTMYRTVAPSRVVDTRPGGVTVDGGSAGVGLRAGGSTMTVQVSGRAGVAAGTEAVTVNVTAVGATANGYLTVFACDDPRPNIATSTYGASAASSTTAIVELSAQGTVCVFNSSTTHVVVDLFGQVGMFSPEQ